MTPVRAAWALALLLVVLAISSCGTSEASGKVVKVRSDRAVELIAAGGHVVLDLRTPTEYAAGHVVGAINLPADSPDFETRVAALDGGASYLVYARTFEASGPLADRLASLGVKRVVDGGAFGLLAIAGASVVEGDVSQG